jgi:hypothetical protein
VIGITITTTTTNTTNFSMAAILNSHEFPMRQSAL